MKQVSCVAALLLIVFAAAGTYGQPPQKTEAAMLKYTLKAKESYTQDQEVNICFRLENVSNEKLWVLTWYTPLEGIKGKIFRVTRDGEKIPYQGRMVKRGNPARKHYVGIEPKSSLSAQVDLSLAYDLSKPGQYRVEFKGRLHDVTKEESSLPRSQDRHSGMDIAGNAVTFKLILP